MSDQPRQKREPDPLARAVRAEAELKVACQQRDAAMNALMRSQADANLRAELNDGLRKQIAEMAEHIATLTAERDTARAAQPETTSPQETA